MTDTSTAAPPDLTEVGPRVSALVQVVSSVLSGRDDAVRTTVAVLLAGGHLLLEDVPGVGKTTLARALAAAVGGTVGRIQFTPDLLPADVTGVSIYRAATGDFVFHPGPIFATVVIGDEINRASPKTQSALLECMQEGRVTVDGVSHELPEVFMVLATQNPVEMEGTYPLPEAQRDRFMARLALGYPPEHDELELLDSPSGADPAAALTPVVTEDEVAALRTAINGVHASETLRRYVLALARATRSDEDILLGASPRAAMQLVSLARAVAAMAGRDYVLPDDVQAVAEAALAHRLVLAPSARMAGGTATDVVRRLVAATPVPASVR
ncbi:ATPase associated with various cellular activities AAA_3 [Beutenbergia cavernae DSM 12333]|uniref:ATPase associated with various cellular activities AAA_3 n=1 Tax=Beutenbergia cavernae (strain ATCC BAA-8 / DSM 12333 / CCUG 43141 / JCM 11478 / NBRC 16432 / NCIMB 13614 / HKI 0122) TaxID=471853 RepID=C5BW69_BEUC1|nr:MoxR family ATPase [Beutenbergia cavernae]ACQ80670.1 ATPase associated with various cellular activities AAA_3 [Beutenbergia cavernae DSM 12333]